MPDPVGTPSFQSASRAHHLPVVGCWITKLAGVPWKLGKIMAAAVAASGAVTPAKRPLSGLLQLDGVIEVGSLKNSQGSWAPCSSVPKLPLLERSGVREG